MFQKAFESSYTSFDSTGAAFITQHTRVKLVGIDYLSIGCLEDIVETHRVLLGQVRALTGIAHWGTVSSQRDRALATCQHRRGAEACCGVMSSCAAFA
jgi:kynurenine formamidase